MAALPPHLASPDSPEFNQLLENFADPRLSLPALAASANRTLIQLLDWAEYPAVAAAIRALHAAARTRLHLTAASLAPGSPPRRARRLSSTQTRPPWPA